MRLHPAPPRLPAPYQLGRENLCPGCGRSQWNMGRSSAECAFCCTAVPLAGRA